MVWPAKGKDRFESSTQKMIPQQMPLPYLAERRDWIKNKNGIIATSLAALLAWFAVMGM